MKHSVPHSLGLETARKVVHAAFDNYSQRFSDFTPQATWASEDKAKVSFSAKGMSIDGRIEVRPNSIDIELDVPFLLRPFQGKAIEVIEREITKWADKAKKGELT